MDNLCIRERRRFYNSDGEDIAKQRGALTMRRVYDVFEKFPDGSTLWRASVTGRFEAEQIMLEWAEYSTNEYFLFEAEDFLPIVSTRRRSRTLIESAAAG